MEPPARTPEAQLAFEDRLFRVLGLVGGLGFWEAWRLPLVCRELRFGFSGGGAPADMIKLGLEKRGVWAKLREARAARREKDGCTLLLAASASGTEQRVCELIELGWPGSVDARTDVLSSPVIWAGYRGSAPVIKLLLAAGADVNAASTSQFTALLWAAFFGFEAPANHLIAAGADVNALSRSGYTPLNCARGRGGHPSAAVEAALLAAGATAE
jgi:hypothetical protein